MIQASEATSTRLAASAYNGLGFSTVPVRNDKLPTCAWKQFQNAIPTAAEHLSLFVNGHYGVGVITGQVSGNLEAIDIDVKYDLTGSLMADFTAAIKDHSSDLFAKLVIAKTVNNGFHAIYRCSSISGNKKLAQRPATATEADEGDKVKALIEIRGEGGYIVAAPTPGYSFVKGDLSTVQEITPDERSLLFAIARSFDQMPAKLEDPRDEHASGTSLSPGMDYNQKADVPSLLQSRGWTITSRQGDRIYFKRPGVTSSKVSANYHEGLKCLYVFSTSTEFESEKGYSPVAVYAQLEHGGDFKAAFRELYAKGYGERRGVGSEPQSENLVAWHEAMPENLPDELLPVPAFDGKLLPEALREFVTDTADRMRAPDEFIAGAVIVGAASIIGNTIQIAPKRLDTDWIVTPNLWGAAIARPGKNKTATLEKGLAPLKKREEAARAAYDEQLKDFGFTKLTREANLDSLKGKLKEAAKKGQKLDSLKTEYDLLASEAEPTPQTYIINDVTVEKLAVLLQRNPRGFLYLRDELTGLLRSLDREDNSENKAFLLETWNGSGSRNSDRIARGETRVKNMTLSLFGGVQPGAYAAYLRSAIGGGQYDDGFAQRMQIAFYPDFKKWELVDRKPNYAAIDLANKCFAKLDALCAHSDSSVVLTFDEEAQQFFYEWWTDLEQAIEDGEFGHPALESHFAKYRSLMPSLALIFHLFDVISTANSLRADAVSPVSLDAAEKAAAWCQLLGEHAKRIYGLALRQETTQAKTIIQKIKTGKLGSQFTARDIYRNGWTGLQTSIDCSAPLQMLCDYGYLFPLSVKTTEKGGQPTTSYVAHPSLHSPEESQS